MRLRQGNGRLLSTCVEPQSRARRSRLPLGRLAAWPLCSLCLPALPCLALPAFGVLGRCPRQEIIEPAATRRNSVSLRGWAMCAALLERAILQAQMVCAVTILVHAVSPLAPRSSRVRILSILSRLIVKPVRKEYNVVGMVRVARPNQHGACWFRIRRHKTRGAIFSGVFEHVLFLL